MKRSATLALIAAATLLVARPPVASAQILLFDYLGFDYEDPNPNPALFGEVGSGYVGLGTVPGVFAPLVADSAKNEYTYHLTGATSVAMTPAGPFVIISYGGGTITLYEDSKSTGTASDFGTSPPNAVAPSTFVDGTPILVGTLTAFQLILNTSNNSGSYEAQYTAVGGTQLSNIPPDQRTGWTFAGATSNATVTPGGYAHQIDGQVFLNQPVPARRSSWGRIKATYR
jgi:hypothetical protein